jgi:hypothetical protein
VSSNFGNEGERNRRATEGDAIAGQTIEKPLMYFCFDLTPELDTVALTCPKIELDNNIKIAKCCPEGQESTFAEGCTEIEDKVDRNWSVPINGHLFAAKMLENNKRLVYDSKKVFNI